MQVPLRRVRARSHLVRVPLRLAEAGLDLECRTRHRAKTATPRGSEIPRLARVSFSFELSLLTFLSKKYNPVMTFVEFVFFGFSMILIFFLFCSITPYALGFLTLYEKIFAPLSKFMSLLFNSSIKPCP